MEKGEGFRYYKRKIGCALAAFVALASMSGPMRELRNLPGSISITEGYDLSLRLSLPFAAEADNAAVGVLGTTDSVQKLGKRAISLSGQREGSAKVTLRFMGILPIRTVSVSVEEEKMLVPGGLVA